MKTYWDLSEKERAVLSREDVEAFGDAELMTKGVLSVAPPTLEPEPEVAALPKAVYFRVRRKTEYGMQAIDIMFRDTADVKIFLGLAPLIATEVRLNDDWGQRMIVASDLREEDIVGEMLPHEHTVAAVRADLEKQSAIRLANERRQKEYDEALTKQREALAGMFEDWTRCQELGQKHRKVASTFEAYTETAGGERDTAFRFLRKVFSDAEIVDASEWCGFKAPAPFYLHKASGRYDSARIEEIHEVVEASV